MRSYECSDYANNNQAKKFLRQLDKTNVHPILETKSRMQVMLTTNLNVSSGLCNGSRGVLLGYKKFSAWYGGVDKEDMNRRYTEQGTSRIAQWGRKNFLLPFVLFSNGQKVTIGPHILTCKFDNGKLSVSRIQIPLIPAWSITIHKVSSSSPARSTPPPRLLQPPQPLTLLSSLPPLTLLLHDKCVRSVPRHELGSGGHEPQKCVWGGHGLRGSVEGKKLGRTQAGRL